MNSSKSHDVEAVRAAVVEWIDTVVAGLNLCPFAAGLDRERRLRVTVTRSRDADALLARLESELWHLWNRPASEVEGTVLAAPLMLAAFEDYNDFLDPVDALLEAGGWSGCIQVASFHPDYRFAGSQADDIENFTNRSPVPLFHLLREESVAQALARWPTAGEEVPARNLQRLRDLSASERARLWPAHFSTPA